MIGSKIHFIVDMEAETLQFTPHFGVAYLSAYLKKYLPGVQVSLSCISDDVKADIARIKPDIIAFSSTSRHFIELKELAAKIKEGFAIPIIWGGVHITIAPNELPESAEVGVLGEGEETLIELLSRFEEHRFNNLDNIKGIVYRKNKDIVVNQRRSFIEPLDKIPYPDVDLFNIKWNKSYRAVMLTGRGCPYDCSFCASSIFWTRKTRLHSPEYVVNQIKALAEKYHVKEILIYDDLFTVSKKRIEKIADLINKQPELKKLRFECLSRVDIFDEPLAEKLKEMGVYRISFGIESGCQNTLDYLKNKTINLAQVEKAIDIAKRYGFECVGSFIIGSPFEKAEDIEQTLAFIEKLGLKNVQITIATPFPGTKLWEDGRKIGKIDSDSWSDDYYTLFALNADIINQLQDKKFLTQIEREEFFDLVKHAIKIQEEINFSLKRALETKLYKYKLGFMVKLWRWLKLR